MIQKSKKIGALVLILVLSACSIIGGTTEFTPSEYISTTGTASPGEETRIALADGAAIVIPANSIREEIFIMVERTPEKANSLPPLGDNIVQLGDFYNFEISGDIVGPVDLVLPFDSTQIPQGEGVLVFAYPTEDGWRYEPVVADGNTVTIYTDNVGDPLIAWHFSEDGKPVCDPKIAIQAVPSGESFKLIGQVIPVKNNIWGQAEDQAAANIDVLLELNLHGWRDQSLGRSYTVTTDLDGSFQLDLSQEGIIEGWNWVFASAECDPWFGQFAVESEGYAEFKYRLVSEVAEGKDSETFDQVEVADGAIPPGAVLLPDFIGQSLNDAIDWLESNGFGYTWIDGSSTYDLGMVFDQAPGGEKYKVPHRTVVVLYRTVDRIDILGDWVIKIYWDRIGEEQLFTLRLNRDGTARIFDPSRESNVEEAVWYWSFSNGHFRLTTKVVKNLGETVIVEYLGTLEQGIMQGTMRDDEDAGHNGHWSAER